ncbi:MAG: hypothetical protein PHO36_16260 [Parabacteroides sp.]|nr:hypothetical protein [Parabacteroides sp.]
MMKKFILIVCIGMTFTLISGCTPIRPDPRYLTFMYRDRAMSLHYSNEFIIDCGGNLSHGWKIFETKLQPMRSFTHPPHQTAPFVRPTFLMRVDEGVRWWLIKAGETYYLLDQEKAGRIRSTYTKEELPEMEGIGITGKVMIGKREAQYIDTDAATDLFPLDGIICSNNRWGFLIQPGDRFWVRVTAFFVCYADKIFIGESEDINDLVRPAQERNANNLNTKDKPDESVKEDVYHPLKGFLR